MKLLLPILLALSVGTVVQAQVPAQPTEAAAGAVLFPMLRIPVPETTKVERHSQVRERTVEAVIRGIGKKDLASVLTGRTNPYVTAMDARSTSGGTWILEARMRKPEWDLRIAIDNGFLVVEVVAVSYTHLTLPTICSV